MRPCLCSLSPLVMKQKANHLIMKLQEGRDLVSLGYQLYLHRAGAQ